MAWRRAAIRLDYGRRHMLLLLLFVNRRCGKPCATIDVTRLAGWLRVWNNRFFFTFAVGHFVAGGAILIVVFFRGRSLLVVELVIGWVGGCTRAFF